MNNYKILRNYLLYLLLGFIIFLVGITGVFADTTLDTSTWVNITGINWSETGLLYTGNPSFNSDWLLNSYQITSGSYVNGEWNYVEFSFFEHSGSFNPCNSTSKFSASFSLLFTNPIIVDSVVSVKWGSDNCGVTSRNNQTGLIELSCAGSPSSNNQTDIMVYYVGGGVPANVSGYVYISRDIDIACGLNTDAIINNDNANTQNIINNNNNNTQQIIDSSASNTQALIDSNKVCYTKKIDSSYKDINNSTLNSSGNVASGYTNWSVSDYIKYDSLELLDNWANSTAHTCFYDSSKTLISCSSNSSLSVGIINVSGAKYFRTTFYNSIDKPIFKITYCENGSQALDDSINNLNDTLNDSSSIDISSLGNTVGWLPAGPIDSIINLPLNLFNSLLTALSGTCSPLTINLPFVNEDLTVPCISTIFGQINGLTTFWNWVGRIASIYILYHYLLGLWNYYDRLTTLQANFRDDFGGGV